MLGANGPSGEAVVVQQGDLFEFAEARALLDQLLADSRLYHGSAEYLDLLGFVARLRNFAPFNAMLLQIQRPGLVHAASARDWRERFERTIKDDARPLLILWPFGPVALVYDVGDTTGKELPRDVASFFAQGAIDASRVASFSKNLTRSGIHTISVDAGDGLAGSIKAIRRSQDRKEIGNYELRSNRNHEANVQFATLAHELGHLFLGHLGPDRYLNIPQRPPQNGTQEELEAESVAYLVCERNGVKCGSHTYLANYVQSHTSVDDVDVYQIMRAAGQVEALLGLSAHTKYDRPSAKAR